MNTNLWPYIELSRCLIKKERKGFGNMFRHQIETFAILIENGYNDPVMLKAALIHDLVEDGHTVGFTEFDKVITTDEDGQEVFDLVHELSVRLVNNKKEPKAIFLDRIMQAGTQKAKVVKLADRLSNINALLATHDLTFINRYLNETRKHIVPYATQIDKNMARELNESILKFDFL